MHHALTNLSRLLTALLILAALGIALAWRGAAKLPRAAQLVEGLDADPLQEPTDEQPFEFTYAGKDYAVEPLYRYALRGLVVSHNDIHAFADIYHDKSSVDIKDLCIIWGRNVSDDTFHSFRFSSEPWSCHLKTDSQQALANFRLDQLSNNHLLSDDEGVRKTIRSISLGDQIELNGMLVNYAPSDSPALARRSSITRDDTGNGACEVFFVDEARILKSPNAHWRSLAKALKALFLLLLLAEIAVVIRIAYVETAEV